MSTNFETLADLRGMMLIMRKNGYKDVLQFTVTRTYAREIWRELKDRGVDMPIPNIGDVMRLEFDEAGLVAMEIM